MTNSTKTARTLLLTSALALVLSACGGGGGGGGGSNESVSLGGSTTSNASGGGTDSGAVVDGHVTVAIIDTGIDVNNAAFSGLIDSSSTNILTNSAADLQDTTGHGTWVAGALRNSAASNGNSVNLLIIRADGTFSSCAHGCFGSEDAANAVRYAADRGAKVMNLSFGAPGNMGGTLLSAFQYAADKGAVLVVAAGNEGASEVDSPANFGASVAGHVIAVGSVNASNVISSFSNRAGAAKDYFMVANGENVATTTIGGGSVSASGTSFAAPKVSNAVAAILEHAPYLTAAQVVQILFNTATDLGAAGVDEIYGHGLLNLTAALQPQGSLAVPAGSTVTSGGTSLTASSLSLGSAFGGSLARSAALGNTIALDDYGRAYAVNLAGQVASQTSATRGVLNAWMKTQHQSVSGTQAKTAFGNFTATILEDEVHPEFLQPTDGTASNRTVKLSLQSNLTETTQLTATHGYGLSNQLGLTSDARTPLLGKDTLTSPYLQMSENGSAVVTAHKLGNGFTAKVGFGYSDETQTRLMDGSADRTGQTPKTSVASEIAYKTSGGSEVGMHYGAVVEQDSVLGSTGNGALSLGSGGQTQFVGTHASLALSTGLTLTATYDTGITTASNFQSGGVVTGMSGLRADAFSLGVTQRDAFQDGDRLTMAVSRPLKIVSGSANLNVATGVDASGNIIRSQSSASLAPTGNQVDIETAYGFALSDSERLNLNAMVSLQPGHDANAAPEGLIGVKYQAAF
jgi:hypothetical protein